MSPDLKIPNVAVIPTRDHADDLCCDLITQLLDQDETDKIFVYDNRSYSAVSTESPLLQEWPGTGTTVSVTQSPRKTITEMWNHGWGSAVVFGLDAPVNVAFLNDDITIPPGFMGTLASRVRQDPFWLVGPDWQRPLADGDDSRLYPTLSVQDTARDGGISGWAFMIRGELLGAPLPPIDEQFRYWCGDDDLVQQVQVHGGKCGKITGLPIDHVGTATGLNYPELHTVGWEDMGRFTAKYITSQLTGQEGFPV